MSDRALWTVEAMAAAMGATRAGNLPASVPGLSIDSRTLGRGDAFFAIAGENRDGHDFVAAALEPGDALLIAGKGHESGQIVGDRVLPFTDHAAVRAALEEKVA